MTEKVNINLRDVPRDLRDKFKGACADRGETMTEVLKGLMRDYVERRNTLQPNRHFGTLRSGVPSQP